MRSKCKFVDFTCFTGLNLCSLDNCVTWLHQNINKLTVQLWRRGGRSFTAGYAAFIAALKPEKRCFANVCRTHIKCMPDPMDVYACERRGLSMNKVVRQTTFCDPGYCIMITDDGSVIVIKSNEEDCQRRFS